MNIHFVFACIFTFFIFIGVELNSDIIVAIFGLFMFISLVKGLHKEITDKEKKG
jgi:hypothetical protein